MSDIINKTFSGKNPWGYIGIGAIVIAGLVLYNSRGKKDTGLKGHKHEDNVIKPGDRNYIEPNWGGRKNSRRKSNLSRGTKKRR